VKSSGSLSTAMTRSPTLSRVVAAVSPTCSSVVPVNGSMRSIIPAAESTQSMSSLAATSRISRVQHDSPVAVSRPEISYGSTRSYISGV